jgi:poly-beta-hydroxybutyrate-responsive repressor
MDRFLEICLLLLLKDASGYGYGLIEQLSDFGISASQLNVGSLYRSLRKLEKQELVKSTWEAASQGPRRRVYAITGRGKETLSLWISYLEQRKKKIETVLNRFYAPCEDEKLQEDHS